MRSITLRNMGATTVLLNQKSLVLIFAYAPAGFGHLRVSEALYHGLPKGVSPILLGAQDKAIRTIYRNISTHPLALSSMEWAQSGKPQSLFTIWYRWFLRKRSQLLYQQMLTIFDQRIVVPKTMLVVATHFGLAHQLAVIKHKLEKEKAVRIILIVQVTDDSPQYIWYVPEADIIFVPSHKTKEKLIAYGKKGGLPPARFEVNPYPVSPILSQHLLSHDYSQRIHQVSLMSKSEIHLAIPISGAAVGLGFVTALIDVLHTISPRFVFHVFSKTTPYTQSFLLSMMNKPFVKLSSFSHDREVISAYEQIYQQHIISLEITKPSEQAFKTLLSPRQIGGSVLLFSEPVGKQEYDNLDFLKRHGLIPTEYQTQYLHNQARKDKPLDLEQEKTIHLHALCWRGLMIPKSPLLAASFIWWALRQRIFERMMYYSQKYTGHDKHPEELNPNGVGLFWKKVSEYLHETS